MHTIADLIVLASVIVPLKSNILMKIRQIIVLEGFLVAGAGQMFRVDVGMTIHTQEEVLGVGIILNQNQMHMPIWQ